MSTDLYGVRILDVDPEDARFRVRVFVVYYDTHHKFHQPVPDDRSFFVRVLCDKDALGDDISDDDKYSEGYINRCAFRYIERFAELERRNFPLPTYEGMSDFYYERSGAWQDEEMLVQADYDVWVTDPAYLEALSVGDSWGTTSYQTRSDDLGWADYARVPDFNDEQEVFTPFPERDDLDETVVGRMVFSADGKHLLVNHAEGGWRVFATADWSLVAEEMDVGTWGHDPGWTRDGRVAWHEGGAYVALDIHTGERRPLATFGNQSGASGSRLLSTDCETEEISIFDADGLVLHSIVRPYEMLAYAAFDAAGGLCACALEGQSLKLIDLGTGASRLIGEGRFNSVSMSPDGRHILASTYSDVRVIRVEDGAVIRQLQPHQRCIPTATAWSPDGRLAATSMTDAQGARSTVVIHRIGQAIIDAAAAPVAPPPRVEKDITDLARLYVSQTARFSAGWNGHIDDDLIDFHLALVRMGRDCDLVGAMNEAHTQIMARACESIIARKRGDEARADRALADALRREAAETIGTWANTFVYAPLAAAQHLAGEDAAAEALLKLAMVELEKESNRFQKRAVLCRALLEMGRLDAVAQYIDDEAEGGLSYISQFHHRLLTDLVDAGADALSDLAWKRWGCASDRDTQEVVCGALLRTQQPERALALEGLSTYRRAGLWQAWLAADAPTAQAALDRTDDPALRKLIEAAPAPPAPREGFEALCADGHWEEAYAVLSGTKKTLRNPLYQTIASEALARGDIGIMLAALRELPCHDMNAPGLRALQRAFKSLAGEHYRTVHF